MARKGLLKLTKVQTTKLIVITVLIIWILCTFSILATLIFKDSLIDSRIVDIMGIYGQVTLVMNAVVLGYLAKSTYENQHKYGTTPYGQTQPPSEV